MRLYNRMIKLALIALVVMFATVACGDDEVEGDSGGDVNAGNDVGNHENDSGAIDGNNDEEGCDEDQGYNPTTGECFDLDNNNDNNNDDNNDENNGGPDLNDPNLGADECEDDEIFDEVSQECLDEDEWAAICGPGIIDGQTCRPDGGVLPGAEVQLEGVNCDGSPLIRTTVADDAGYYRFEDVDAGVHELSITSGSFEITDEVNVYKDETTDLKDGNAKICLEGTEVDIAVIIGSFDDIPPLLEGMNISYDVINPGGLGNSLVGDFLSDVNQMAQYDIIFVECSSPWDFSGFSYDMEDIKNNVRTFMEMGNSLYASDWSHNYIQDSIPEAIQFHNQESGGSPRDGDSGTLTANVVSNEMLNLLGTDTTQISFALPGWAIAVEGGPGATVHFRGDAPISGGYVEDAALMTTYHDLIGNGRLIYTSFHNGDQLVGDMQEILEFMIFQL